MSIDYLQEKIVTKVLYSKRHPNGMGESDGIGEDAEEVAVAPRPALECSGHDILALL